MLQFTADQIGAFTKRKDYLAIKQHLHKTVAEVEGHFMIPPSKAATWSGFYACPKHSAKLVFDITSPKAHRCSVDGEMIEGEIFDGAWWRILNDVNQAACYSSALLYLLDGEEKDFELARKYLVEYAKVYPGYEIHGGIPYNNPGKANAQTLCDAAWIKGLIFAYDIIKDKMPEEEQKLVEKDLFYCCAEFLMEYRTNQIHNHEVIADSAVAMIGLLIGEERFINFGLYEPYGVDYQLEHGILKDGLWFEGTPGYHFYMLEQILYFEMLARTTKYSYTQKPEFIEILKFPLHLIQPDGVMPPLNDVGFGYSGFAGSENIYELAYLQTKDEDLLSLLQCVYDGRERSNLYSFFYGVEDLPQKGIPKAAEYHADEEGSSGLTTMLGPEERFLLVKHSPFGGEHDHYDRLGLHFTGLGKYAMPDLGTTLYGAPLHYDYYKNTATHNTVCINGENQPPANCTVHAYKKTAEYTLLDAGVKWDGSYTPLDSFVIPQWSDEAYEGAEYRRAVIWFGDFFVDLFKVDVPQERTIDYTLHIRGERKDSPITEAHMEPWATKGASRFFHDAHRVKEQAEIVKTVFDAGDGVELQVLALPQGNTECYYLLGPDNPSTSDLSYLVERVTGTSALFVNVVSLYKDGPIVKNAACTVKADGTIELQVTKSDGSTPEVVHAF